MSYDIRFFNGREKVYTLTCVAEGKIDESIETMKRYHGFDKVKILRGRNMVRQIQLER